MTLRSLACALLTLAACGPEPAATTDASASESSDGSSTSGETTGTTTSASTTSAATGTTAEATTTAATSDATSSGTTLMPDPDYERECQPGDFVCKDEICDLDGLGLGACYKPCTPDPGKIGEPDAECNEPERPFCSQIGLVLGGDFNCNGCVHICVAYPANTCDQPFDACPAK